jgi:hypothetical protein
MTSIQPIKLWHAFTQCYSATGRSTQEGCSHTGFPVASWPTGGPNNTLLQDEQ